MIIQPAKRTESVKEYFFSIKNREMAKLNQERAARGEDPIINLGIGSPDGTPPRAALEVVAKTAVLDGVHGYQSYMGLPELRQALSDWYARYYGVTLDPGTEIQPLTGSKEGILLISLTFLNAGDQVLVPAPGYPTYTSASQIAEAEVIKYDLVAEKGWVPDFDALEAMDLTGVKMMWTNYPNMPTGGRATRELYESIVKFAREHNILVVNDNPYSFILNRDEHLSILQVEGAKECCIEFNSMSKSHNMPGWRVAMLATNAEFVKWILKVKSNIDSGTFRPVQLAAAEAYRNTDEWHRQFNIDTYAERRTIAEDIMKVLGCRFDPSQQGMFLWGRIPDSIGDVEELTERVLHEARVFITPGFIFGSNGRRFIRISLCAKPDKMREALNRIKAIMQ
ncbi:MAG: aminotransferase class I/II-fold pyridoxal phosphate-dependent enzyme [Bacteroidales bacterium]|nr:aminotransferase class I/II-fold pyridoxal phosphate-dependent enzyme [Bacteroidales bacterium]